MSISDWIAHKLPNVWLTRGTVSRLLTPLSMLHGALLVMRRWAYELGLAKINRLPVRVIVVGNVVAGGAGKTPVTLALVSHLQKRGFRIGVISRGHGRRTHDTREVFTDSLPQDVGDEPLMIRQKSGVTVWVGANRAEAGRSLLQQHPEVDTLVCDDGLQHLALARDLEICVMDDRGVGNGWLLPAGPLREKWPKRVDLLLHTAPNGLPGGFQAERKLGSHALNAQGQRIALSTLQAQTVDAVAGIARPEAFFSMLRLAGLTLHNTTALPDHCDYSNWPSRTLSRPLLCTEKDASKLWQVQPDALAIPLELNPEADFWQKLDLMTPNPKSQTATRTSGDRTNAPLVDSPN
jgi:tetraacyldisaccharide 4'-kinase